MRALERRGAEEDAVVGDDADALPVDGGEAGDERGAVVALELGEAGAVDEARDDLVDGEGLAEVGGGDADEVRGGVEGFVDDGGGEGMTGQLRLLMLRRARTMACASSTARKSVTPDTDECILPPPRSSGLTTSPVAALTSGGPARKMRPCSWTMMLSSLMAGT